MSVEDRTTREAPVAAVDRGTARRTLLVASGAGFLAGLDTTAVNLALPDVQRDLGASLAQLQWVVNAFSLLSATLLVLAGNLSDRLGARRVFLGGLLAFAVTSAACGVAWSAVVLDVARATQGAAAAAVIASAFALVAETFAPHERGRALGTYGSFAALSFVVGPLAGGVLADVWGWRSVFMVNLPFAAAVLAAAAVVLPRREPARGRAPLDPAGVVAFVVGIGAVQYGAMRATDRGWDDAQAPLAVVLGLVVLAAFVALERRSDGAFLDLRLFRNRVFSGACVATALASAAYFGVLVYLSLFLQTTQDFTAAETGLLYLPTILPYMAVSPVAGRLADRFPGPVVPAVGCAVLALGMVLLAGVQHGAGMLDVTPALVVMGAGSGLVLTPLTKAGLDQVASGRSGMASGVLQTVRPLGVTAGVTLLGVPVADAVDATAFRSVALLAASLAAAAAVVSAGLLRRPR